jgi:pyruvate/2-oxoglutarate dehydrogenase complex dihydrolipoamide acyltransferase (E2) component
VSSLFEFPLPDIGEGVAEGEIVQWMVKEGDAISEDQEMVEVMTDKATVPITSPIRGTIREIVVQAGEVVPVGAVLVKIEPAAGAHVPKVAAHGDGHGAAPAKQQKAAPAAAATNAAPAAKAAPAKAKAATAMPSKAQQAPRSAKAAELPETPAPPAEGEDMEEREIPVGAGARSARAVARQVAPEPEAAPAQRQIERSNGQRALATPYTRRLARELTIDIETLQGTGEAGRVTEGDVRAAADAVRAPKPTVRPAAAPSLSEQVAAKRTEAPAADALELEERIPIRGLRKRIAERMHQSKTTAAHFTYVDECDVTELVALRGQMKERAAKRGVKLTYMPFIAKAIVSALQEYPSLNGTTDDEAGEFVIKRYFNFGIAVDTDSGLIVPVVKGVDRRSLLDLAQEMDRIASEAREGKSKLEDLKDGTFTITNAGNIGGLFATPIINYPEAAILGVHAIKKKPAVVDGEIKIRDIMYLSISIDHRMNDGAVGARFMNRVIELLQDPTSLFLEM